MRFAPVAVLFLLLRLFMLIHEGNTLETAMRALSTAMEKIDHVRQTNILTTISRLGMCLHNF